MDLARACRVAKPMIEAEMNSAFAVALEEANYTMSKV